MNVNFLESMRFLAGLVLLYAPGVIMALVMAVVCVMLCYMDTQQNEIE